MFLFPQRIELMERCRNCLELSLWYEIVLTVWEIWQNMDKRQAYFPEALFYHQNNDKNDL